MLTRQQKEDRKKCDEMIDEQGKTMECARCSCSVCITQQSTFDIKELHKKIEEKIKEIDKRKGGCMNIWNCGRLEGETNGLKMVLDTLNKIINGESEDK